MPLFSFDPRKTVTGTFAAPAAAAPAARARGEAAPRARGASEPARETAFVRDDGVALAKDELDDQFIVYQLSKELQGPAILDSTAVTPSLEGTDAQPDVLAKLNLISFHVGAGDEVDRDTRATMRITLGKDPSSASRILDTAFWAVAAGMKLFADEKPAQDKQLAADINRAFANRPIEIAGGLGLLSFEVVKHEEPKWWQKLFGFLRSGTGEALTSVLGFPGVTQPALALVDELLGRLDEEKHEVLFQSAPMRLALTQRAHEEFTGGNPRVKLGCLDQGHCVLARGRDRNALVAADPVFLPTHGILVPATADPGDTAALTTKNPLHELTYAVFRVQTKSTLLDPDFNFR
jgi:hypothetical protein